jgi:transposase
MKKDLISGSRCSSSAAPERKGGERSEPDWSEGAATAPAEPPRPVVVPSPVPSSEVLERPVRRFFSAEYKRSILREADLCQPGELAVLLRREGLYSSHLTTWRLQRETGELDGLAPKKRGRKTATPNPLSREVERLRRENEELQRRLAQAELVIEVQKKISGLLGIPLSRPEDGGNA